MHTAKYLTKIDLDSSMFLYENLMYMSIRIMVIPSGITRTWMDINTGFLGKYRAI